MEEQDGDCNLVFPHQGLDDGYAFVFDRSRDWNNVSFHVGQGYGGEENKLLGDGLDLQDQLKLICEFCQNPYLKHLRVDATELTSGILQNTAHLSLIWTTLMRELQGSASLKYIEFRSFPKLSQDGELWIRPFVEMLSSNSSLLGLKMLTFERVHMDVDSFIEGVIASDTLQLLHFIFDGVDSSIHFTFDGVDSSIQALEQLMASLSPNSIGYKSNNRLRALYMGVGSSLFGQFARGVTHFKPLVEAFINMLETNKTLTTIQIPDFVRTTKDIVEVLHALEVNQSISNIILGVDRNFDSIRYGEFSKEEVYFGLLKLIKFRNDHGNGLNTVDVRGTSLERTEYDVHIQGVLKKKYYNDGSYGEFFVRPMSCGVFLCGFPEAGKTTLRKKMKYILHAKSKKFHLLYSLSKRVELPFRRVFKRTIGVEVVTTQAEAVELSFWDMGGQDEYHAYHDLVIPNLSDNGSASLFILVCSMTTIKDGARSTNAKSTKAIELELQYWLRFLSSNTRTSRNLKPHVLVVFTHVDILPKSMNVRRHVEDLLTSLKHKFGDSFHFSSMEYFVNSNSIQMVEPLIESVVKEVEAVLTKVPNIFAACLQMRDEITKWKGDHPCETIMKWRDFVHMCWEVPQLKKTIPHLDPNLVEDICKTISASLNEGGYVMYFEDLDVIVVDPNWFGTRIIGSLFSIDYKFLDPHTKEPVTNKKGYMERDTLVSILENSFKDKRGILKKQVDMAQHVEVDDLICVMKRMNVCFEEHSALNNEKQKKSIFTPATLRDEGGLAHQGRRKLNWNAIGSSSIGSVTYIGRRLQCEDLERTFLTPGFFPRLQVVLERKFGSKSTFRLEKNMVTFAEDGMEVLVEQSGDLTSDYFINGFIDIMVQSLKTSMKTLQFVKQEVMKPIQRLCASPTFGCQGVTLSQSILRPECVKHLWLCHDRRDQAVNERVLIEKVLSKEDFEGYIHHWPNHHGDCHVDEAHKLLGEVVWDEEIVNRRIANMTDLTIVLMQEQDQDVVSIKMDEIGPKEECEVASLEELYKKLREEMGKDRDSIVERVNKHTDETIHGMRREVLEEVSKSVNRLIDHSMQLLKHQVPCYVYVTTNDLEHLSG